MDLQPSEEVKQMCSVFQVSNSELEKIMNSFLQYVEPSNFGDSIDDKCSLTYIQDFPVGMEQGRFLSLQLSLQKCRVILCKFSKNCYDFQCKLYEFPEEIKHGSSATFFRYIGLCCHSFLKERGIQREGLVLAVVASLPLLHRGVSVSILKSTSRFPVLQDIIGKDITKEINEAFSSISDLNVKVCVTSNEVVAVLLCGVWHSSHTLVGLLLGENYNCCYIEEIACFSEDNGYIERNKPLIIFNTECEKFGEDGELDSIKTKYDIMLDSLSPEPGKQVQEKMICASCLSELTRLVLEAAAKAGFMFNGNGSELLFKPGSFTAKQFLDICGENSEHLMLVQSALTDLHIETFSDEDCINAYHICKVIWQRAVSLISANVAAIINKLGHEQITVAVDAYTYTHIPFLQTVISKKINELIQPHISCDLRMMKNSRLRGACMIPALVCNERSKSHKSDKSDKSLPTN